MAEKITVSRQEIAPIVRRLEGRVQAAKKSLQLGDHDTLYETLMEAQSLAFEAREQLMEAGRFVKTIEG